MRNHAKKLLLIFLSLLCIFTVAGCDDPAMRYEETQITTTVISCDDGVLRLNAVYLSTANMYLAQKNTAMYSMYYSMAITHGKTIFTVKINIDGEEHKIEREEKFEAGQQITVTKKLAYKGDELIRTEYK